MLEYFDFDKNNERVLCEMGGKNADMLMTIRIKKFAENEEITVLEGHDLIGVIFNDLVKNDRVPLFCALEDRLQTSAIPI